MTVRELYSKAVHDLTEKERLQLAGLILRQKDGIGSDETGVFAESGERLAARLGTPGEFDDWEQPGA